MGSIVEGDMDNNGSTGSPYNGSTGSPYNGSTGSPRKRSTGVTLLALYFIVAGVLSIFSKYNLQVLLLRYTRPFAYFIYITNYLIAPVMIIAAIGMLMLKEWSRKFLTVMLIIGIFTAILLPLNTSEVYKSTMWASNFLLFYTIIAIAFNSLIICFLAHPKIKAQFGVQETEWPYFSLPINKNVLFGKLFGKPKVASTVSSSVSSGPRMSISIPYRLFGLGIVLFSVALFALGGTIFRKASSLVYMYGLLFFLLGVAMILVAARIDWGEFFRIDKRKIFAIIVSYFLVVAIFFSLFVLDSKAKGLALLYLLGISFLCGALTAPGLLYFVFNLIFYWKNFTKKVSWALLFVLLFVFCILFIPFPNRHEVCYSPEVIGIGREVFCSQVTSYHSGWELFIDPSYIRFGEVRFYNGIRFYDIRPSYFLISVGVSFALALIGSLVINAIYFGIRRRHLKFQEMTKAKKILSRFVIIGAGLFTAILFSVLLVCLTRILMPVNYEIIDVALFVCALIFLVFFITRGRRYNWIRLSVFVIGGIFLAVYVIMGVYCAVTARAIPVPFLKSVARYNVIIEPLDYEVYAIGWEGQRLFPAPYSERPKIRYAMVSFGYYHGLKQNLPSIAIRDFNDKGSYLGIVMYSESQPRYEPCKTESF